MKQPIAVKNSLKAKASIKIPEDAAGQEIHILLEVADNADAPLKRFHRILIHVEE